ADPTATGWVIPVARLKKDGRLDRSFDGDGKQIIVVPTGSGFWVTGLAVQQNGKVVVLGSDIANNFYLSRLNTDGSLDKSFDGDGRQLIDFGGGALAFDVAVQRDGKIVAVGFAVNQQTLDSDFALVRLLGKDANNSPAISITDVVKREGHSGTTAFDFAVS